jgi:hypothetical protein
VLFIDAKSEQVLNEAPSLVYESNWKGGKAYAPFNTRGSLDTHWNMSLARRLLGVAQKSIFHICTTIDSLRHVLGLSRVPLGDFGTPADKTTIC